MTNRMMSETQHRLKKKKYFWGYEILCWKWNKVQTAACPTWFLYIETLKTDSAVVFLFCRCSSCNLEGTRHHQEDKALSSKALSESREQLSTRPLNPDMSARQRCTHCQKPPGFHLQMTFWAAARTAFNSLSRPRRSATLPSRPPFWKRTPCQYDSVICKGRCGRNLDVMCVTMPVLWLDLKAWRSALEEAGGGEGGPVTKKKEKKESERLFPLFDATIPHQFPHTYRTVTKVVMLTPFTPVEFLSFLPCLQ